jgi:hypothetical protein
MRHVQQLNAYNYRTCKVIHAQTHTHTHIYIYIYIYTHIIFDLINYPISFSFIAVCLLREVFRILIVLKLLTDNHW